VIAVDQEMFISDRVAVLLRYAIAYSTGLTIRVEWIRGPETDGESWISASRAADLAPFEDDAADGDADQLQVRPFRSLVTSRTLAQPRLAVTDRRSRRRL
jgi:hypothetical protein